MLSFYLLSCALLLTARAAPIPEPEDEHHIDNPTNPLVDTEKPEEKFARADEDEDAKLSFDEFLKTEKAFVDAKREEFTQLDGDHDGFISIEEWARIHAAQTDKANELRANYFGQLFQDFDADFDLHLSQQEVEQILRQRFLVAPRAATFPEIFGSFDTDKDGGLDLQEYMEFDRRFPFEQTDSLRDLKEDGQTQVEAALPPIVVKKVEKLPLVNPNKFIW